MLQVLNLSFDYEDKALLQGVNFSLPPKQLLHLKGRNGSGKTTLLKILAGFLQPQAGDIYYNSLSIHASLSEYQKKLCYVGHKPGISPVLTVKENCFFDLHWQRGTKLLEFSQLLSDFGLQGFENTPCYQLSAGQKRRLSLLRLVMTDASLWLLDEPLVALDSQAIKVLMLCLEKHLQGGGQIIATSHQALPLAQEYLEFSL